MQYSLLLFLLAFGMVTSSLWKTIHTQEDLLENMAVIQSLHHLVNKKQEKEVKAQEK